MAPATFKLNTGAEMPAVGFGTLPRTYNTRLLGNGA